MAHIITEKRRLSSVFWMMLMTVSLQLYAQDTFKIKGRILEKTEQGTVPLYSASVALLNTDSILVTGTVSDDKGKFQLDNVSVGNYFVKLSFIGYETVNIPLTGFNKNLDLGDIELLPDAAMLSEVTVTGSSIARKVDRMLVFPSKEAVKHSYDPYDLIANMQIPNLFVDRMGKKIETDSRTSVQIRINGIKASQDEFLAIPAKDIERIEVIDNPGIKYGDGDVGTVIDIVVKRNTAGGLVNVNLPYSPTTILMSPSANAKLNYKKSQWGLYYSGFIRDSEKSWTDKDEWFHLGDKTIHRIQEGMYKRNAINMHNLSMTYNLFTPDNYTLNIAFRNEIQNAPHGGTNAKLYGAESLDYTLAQSVSDRKSYTPSLDVYFKKQLKNNQDIQFNLVGTLIETESNKTYNELLNETVPLAQIQTNVDGSKKSIWGEAIYSKAFKNLSLSAGARHYQMYANNEYLINDVPTKASMNQANSSVFMDLQGKIKGVNYLLSLGGTRAFFKEGSQANDYYLFTPTFRVNFAPHKRGWMQYMFSMKPSIPSLSSLTSVEQQIDTLQIQRGNPNLKTYQVYDNSLRYAYNGNHLSVSFLIRHEYHDNPVMEEYFIENDKLVRMEQNQTYYQYAEFYSTLALRNIKWGDWSWNAQAAIGLARHWTKSPLYNHTHNVLLLSGSTSLYYKKLGYSLSIREGGGLLWGETILKAERVFNMGLTYTHKNLYLYGGINFPFWKYRNGSERVSKIAPVTLWNYIKDAERRVSFTLRYRFEFGKAFKDRNRNAGYSDKDSGIM